MPQLVLLATSARAPACTSNAGADQPLPADAVGQGPGTKLRNAPKGRVERTEETDLRQAQVVRAEQDREEAQGDGVVEIIDQAIHATG